MGPRAARWARRAAVAALAALALSVACGCGRATRQPDMDPAQVEAERQLQLRLRFQDHLAMEKRLQAVAFRLLAAGAPLCGDGLSRYTGLRLATIHSYPAAWRPAARHIYDMDERLRVVTVLPGSPAEAAGVAEGDLLLAVNGRPVPAGAPGEDAAERLERRMAELVESGGPLALDTLRDGARRAATLTPAPCCTSPVALAQADEVNAYADGRRIVVTAGMLRFARSDAELALVVGHELAHNTLRHMDRKQLNAGLGALLGELLRAAGGPDAGAEAMAAAGSGLFSRGFELEADYVGLYFAALGGYDVADAPDFWRRMAVAYPQVMRVSGSHPDSARRFVALEAAVREISRKKARGLPLLPEFRDGEGPQAEARPAGGR